MNILPQAEARALGLKRYFTGRPCRHGHMDKISLGEAQNRRGKRNEYARNYVKRQKETNGEKYLVRRQALNKNWIENNRDQYNFAKAAYRFKVKLKALDHYSKGTLACAECGFDADIDALVLDHINDDGAAHRKSLKVSSRGDSSGSRLYEALQAQGWPDCGVQVLCANCNTVKQIRKLRNGTTSFEMCDIVIQNVRWKKAS